MRQVRSIGRRVFYRRPFSVCARMFERASVCVCWDVCVCVCTCRRWVVAGAPGDKADLTPRRLVALDLLG